MRKKRRSCPLMLLFVLILGLSGMGATYARWNDRLSIGSRTTTGIMDFIFHKEQVFTISLVDENGHLLENAESMETTFRSNGKTAEITLQFPFSGSYLAENDACFIRMECPISLGDQGTVNTIELSPLDLTSPSYEKAVFTPVSVVLQTDSGEYELPENIKSDYNQPLLLDVYRGVEEAGGYPAGIICLSLQDNSRELLLNMPTELELDEEDLAETSELADELSNMLSDESDIELADDQALHFETAVVVTYHCVLPIYAEQGRDEMMRLPEGADDNE